MEKKMTKKEMFAQILAHLDNPQEREFIPHEIELLEKKSATKSEKKSPAQQANEVIKQAIVDYLTATGERYRVGDIIKSVPECAELSSQKVTPLMTQLVNEFVVVKTVEKGNSYYSIP